METFKKMLDKFVEYSEDNKESFINTAKKKWFEEFEIKTDRGGVSEYSSEGNMQKRAAVNEREDMKAVIERMINIRKKDRFDFYVDEYVRHEAIEFSMENKKDNITDLFDEKNT